MMVHNLYQRNRPSQMRKERVAGVRINKNPLSSKKNLEKQKERALQLIYATSIIKGQNRYRKFGWKLVQMNTIVT